MTQGESAALVVSIIALVIALAAAGFAGWQAITAHLARTQPRPAMWTIELPALNDTFGKSWKLHNVGGSIATDVTLRLGFPVKKVGDPWKDFSIGQAVAPGQSVVIPDTDRMADPRVKMYPNPTAQTPDGWAVLKPGEVRDDARFVNDQYVAIHWRDYKGREKRGRIPVR